MNFDLMMNQPMRITQSQRDKKGKGSNKTYVSAYKRAQQHYEKLLEQHKEQVAKRKLQKQQQREAMDKYQSIKQKMNKVLKKTNRKGQPKLSAQVAVLLEKIENKTK